MLGALALAIIVSAGIWNVDENFKFTRYQNGDFLLQKKAWISLGVHAAGALLLWAAAWRFWKRPGFAALLPAAVATLLTMFVFVEDWSRERLGWAWWLWGVGGSLGVLAWQTGAAARAWRLTPRKARTLLNAWGFAGALLAMVLLGGAIGVWEYRFSALHLLDLRTDAYDFANLHQCMWTLAETGVSTTTVMKYSDVREFGYRWWAEHFTPIQFFLLPFYAPFRSPESLLFLQYLAGALALIPLALALRADIRSRSAALALTLAYMLHPLIARAATNGFHFENFFPPFFFLAYYFYAKRRVAGFVVAMAAAFSVKETLGVYVFPWGLALALFDRERRRWGLLIMGLSALHFVIAMQIVMPWYREGAMHRVAEERYHWVFKDRGLPEFESAGDLVKACLFYPMDTLRGLVAENRWRSPFRLLLPLGLLCLLRPWTLLIFAPAVAINMLSNWPFQAEFEHYHALEVLPLIIVATGSALRRPWQPRGWGRLRRFRACAALALVGATLGAHWGDGLLPMGGRNAKLPPVLWRQRPWALEVYRILTDEVPSDLNVSANYYLCPPLSDREKLYLVPRVTENTDAIFLMKYAMIPPSAVPGNSPQSILEFTRTALESGQWRLARPYDPELGLLWLERSNDGQRVPNAEAIAKDMFLEIVAPWEKKPRDDR
jgi:uncharacterized membrane protein